MIALKKVIKNYHTAAGEYTALRGIDLTISAGEFVAIIGKSGCGKSTLMNMITGIDRPTSGEVWVGQQGIHKLSENQMAKWRGANMGIVFQFFQLLPTLTVMDNIMLPMDFCGLYTPSERVNRAMELLKMMDMDLQAHKLPTALSGGQQQRIAIARSLANDPLIIAADEPTGNLDSKTADDVFRMFVGLAKQGKTIIMVTHDNDMANRVQRVIRISDGAITDDFINSSWEA